MDSFGSTSFWRETTHPFTARRSSLPSPLLLWMKATYPTKTNTHSKQSDTMGDETTTDAAGTNKRKASSTPPDGYVCRLCSNPGHWIQVCPIKKTGTKNNSSSKRQRQSSDHIPVPGQDPSPEDIEEAKELQKITPPKCELSPIIYPLENDVCCLTLFSYQYPISRFLRSTLSIEQGEAFKGGRGKFTCFG